VVADQIQPPSRSPQFDPQGRKPLTRMPADLVTGRDVTDVAAYVGMVAGAGGKDTGRLASVGVSRSKGTAKEQAGVLSIPTDPSGRLAYQYASAQAKPGRVTIESKNDAQIPHDIALQGNGVSAKGAVVQGGGTSKVQVDLKPGTYTFFCTVPGHREGGMAGKLVVR
jgi:plastocyanin